ncbi:MAG: VWA domain-containing protein [Phycisphaerales bacterium]|nr:VWA domain-containing protein [Phycisphaerales bacterium]
MVISPLLALLIALAVAAVVAFAEWVHLRRISRVSRLAFGPGSRPAAWTAIAAPVRVIAAACVTWGLIMLCVLDPQVKTDEATREASKHLLIALDASPSMYLEDAGPDNTKVSRAVWAGKLVQGVLDRLDPATTRISLVAFYTDAYPIFRETFDKEVIRNALDGLPLYSAFKPGPTRLQEGVVAALDVAKPWMPGSATLLVVSDGDTLNSGERPRLPASIADTIVLGVGDPHRSMTVAGHASRQDTTSLKQLATRLGGTFHQGNEHHIPSSLLDELTMIRPRLGEDASLRDLAIILSIVGAAALALLGPALSLAGQPRSWIQARRPVMSGAAT